MMPKLSSVIPPASPSNPSAKLMALVTPTSAKTVSGISHIIAARVRAPETARTLITTPPYKTTTRTAMI